MIREQKIDFVIAWVDGSDLEWQKEKNKYANPGDTTLQVDASMVRYREWDTLRYWFRAVEKYAPWVNQVYFVTCGHVPKWLNMDAPKLHFVRHQDYIPEQYLPTFSPHPIELNLHRIEGLSEHFVYFNYDFYLTAPVQETDFFVNGLPCDSLEETPLTYSWRTPMNGVRANDILFVNEHFDRKQCRRMHKDKWFNLRDPHALIKNLILGSLNDNKMFGLNTHHLPQAYLKKTLEKVWETDPDWLSETCSHKFRDSQDVSQCVFKFWQLMTGEFYPYNKRKFGRLFQNGACLDELCDAIRHQKYKAICFNDAEKIDFEMARKALNDAFDAVLPEKSSFEK